MCAHSFFLSPLSLIHTQTLSLPLSHPSFAHSHSFVIQSALSLLLEQFYIFFIFFLFSFTLSLSLYLSRLTMNVSGPHPTLKTSPLSQIAIKPWLLHNHLSLLSNNPMFEQTKYPLQSTTSSIGWTIGRFCSSLIAFWESEGLQSSIAVHEHSSHQTTQLFLPSSFISTRVLGWSWLTASGIQQKRGWVGCLRALVLRNFFVYFDRILLSTLHGHVQGNMRGKGRTFLLGSITFALQRSLLSVWSRPSI